MIKLILLDIDGVLTDGCMWVNAAGEEFKRISYRDLDALSQLRAVGYTIGFVTGEATPIVGYLEHRLPHTYFYKGCKNKRAVVEQIVAHAQIIPAELCYVGDGCADAAAISYAGLGVCPSDAAPEVRAVARHVLQATGGHGAIAELVHVLRTYDAERGAWKEPACGAIPAIQPALDHRSEDAEGSP